MTEAAWEFSPRVFLLLSGTLTPAYLFICKQTLLAKEILARSLTEKLLK